MTSQAGGRHRRRLSPQPLRNSLLLDPESVSQPGLYLNSGIVANGSRLFGPGLTGAGARFGTAWTVPAPVRPSVPSQAA